MSNNNAPKYNQMLHRKIPTFFDPGEELHLLTQDAYGQRVLNIRVCRIAPSKTGHTGYTMRGFYLSKDEAELLRDHLSDLLEDEGLFDPLPTGLKEVTDTVGDA